MAKMTILIVPQNVRQPPIVLILSSASFTRGSKPCSKISEVVSLERLLAWSIPLNSKSVVSLIHILIFLHHLYKIFNADNVDKIVSAQLPDAVAHPRLHQTVASVVLSSPM